MNIRPIALSLFLYSCTQNTSVVSANEVEKEPIAKVFQTLESAQEINENTFTIVLDSCMFFCLDEQSECTCRCNVGVNKLRNVTYSHSLKNVEQWYSYLDEWTLSQRELNDCKPL